MSYPLLHNKKIILGISGGIAAYKSAELIRLLTLAGAQVQVVVTASALDFIGRTTLQALSGRPVLGPGYDDDQRAMPHIDATRDADLILLAPCTAQRMAQLAHGAADDLLNAMCLARNCPLWIAPAMNVEMWQASPLQRNLAQLQSDGVHIITPAAGIQACGEIGLGRMQEATEIAQAIEACFIPQTFTGHKLVITAGATQEAIDPVRVITNRSSGKMGFALARAFAAAGAEVTLISGVSALTTPYGVTRIDVTSATQMWQAVQSVIANTQLFVGVAAVSDWAVENIAPQKIKKQSTQTTHNPWGELRWQATPDILQWVAQLPRLATPDQPARPAYCVGFAAESENLIDYAQQKRVSKAVDLIIANNGPATFGSDQNQVSLVDASGVESLAQQDKQLLAHALVTAIAARMQNV